MVHDDLLAAAAQSDGGSFSSLEAARAFIEDNWQIELEINEIRDCRQRLIDAGDAEKCGGGLRLTKHKQAALNRVRADWEAAERQAIAEWETAVRVENPMLGEEQIAELREQLRPWLDEVICRHGAEASLLLYPGEPRAKQLIESLGETNLSFLPKCKTGVGSIRWGAFRLFIREPTESQLSFLGRLLNTGFYQTVLSFDPRARHLAAAEAKRTVLYLDTNFLYAVLGVGSQLEAHTANRLLDLCHKLGYSLRVTPWTINELRTSIASSRSDVMKLHRSKKSAKIMAEVSGEKGFAPAYWRALRDQGTDPADFFGKFEHFQRMLNEKKIVEHPEHCAEIDSEVEAIRDYSSPLEGMYGPGAKNRDVIEHDAKHRLLIERLRNQHDPSTYTDVRYWFLTESTNLAQYGRIPILAGGRPKYPFCILTSTWTQIVRSVIPRTENLDAVVVGLLASPYVGYKPAISGVPRVAVERVVSRIDTLEDVPASVAVAMIGDASMAAKIGYETDETEVNRLVEENLTKKASELERRVEANAEEAASAKRERDEAATIAEEAARSAEQADRAKSDSEAERDRAIADAAAARRREEAATRAADGKAEAERALKDEVAAAKGDADQEREAREGAERRTRHWRNGVAIGLAAIILAAGATLLIAGAIESKGAAIAVAIIVIAAVWAALSLISATLGNRVVTLATLAAAVATIVPALWVDHEGAKPKSTLHAHSGSGGTKSPGH